MIHTLTLNPAIDRLLYLPRFERNITCRTRRTLDTIGGKGTHVSINLTFMDQPSTAFGICHGQTGRRIIDMLESCGIDVCFDLYEDGKRETRTNYLLVEDTGDCTIVTESGIVLDDGELAHLLDRMDEVMQPGDYLIFAGDASNSPDPEVYNKIMRRFRERGIRFVLDTSGKSLKACIAEGPYLVKPNLDELSTLVGYDVPQEDEAICRAISDLDKWHVPITAVSLGGDGSIVKADGVFYRVRSPKVNVQNTIGCGDCYLAGFTDGLVRGWDMEHILRHAAAVSSACAESQLSVGFDRKRAEELAGRVEITRL